jgi:hypothetical protein
MLLLTDGTVMCQDDATSHWWKLTPDNTGSYVNGTWLALADGPNSPEYFVSAVLRDGRVFVAGGEYGGNPHLLAAEIYDPVLDSWTTSLPTPTGWTEISDAPSCVFPDGRIMIGSTSSGRCAIYDPDANSWTAATNGKLNGDSGEETWTLLPDQTILTVDCIGHPATEKYVIAADQWVSCGNTPVDLVEAEVASVEIGPALLLPDGRVFAVGATNYTALYTMPPVSNQPGTWATGPTFPPPAAGVTLGAKDAPACLMPNGLVLCVGGPVNNVNVYAGPTYFFEFNPTTNTMAAIANPPTNGQPPFYGRLLLLPTGQVLFSNKSTNIQVYTPTGSPDPVWVPTITSVPSSMVPGGTYTLYGRQITGLSQAVSFGDDAQMATNYPIIRVRNNLSGDIFYCRTFNFSTMGVNTGTVIHNTRFRIPFGAELGASQITVIANGISSAPVNVHVVFNKKIEIKELKIELKENTDIALTEGGQGSGADRQLLAVVRMLAERADQAATDSEKTAKEPFIAESERPEVVGAATGPVAPRSKPKKKKKKTPG